MSLRERYGKLHYRFQYKNREYTENTHLDATPQNRMPAQKIETAAFEALVRGEQPMGRIDPKPFNEAVAEYKAIAKTRYRAHPSSFTRIETSLSSALVYFGKMPVKLIDAAKIDLYKAWRATTHEVRDITIRHDLHALSKFFAHAIRHHWAVSNPIKEVEIPSDADAVRMHVLSLEEEEAYFERARRFPNLYDVGRLMINQGMRPDEVVSLAKSDIDLRAGTIHVSSGKTAAARRVLDMTSESRRIIEARLKGDSVWLFPSPVKPGKHIFRINSAHDTILAEAAKEGVHFNFVPYDFRHTFATSAAESGITVPALAALLGHASFRCVQKYVHLSAEHKRAAMKRFERAQRRRKTFTAA